MTKAAIIIALLATACSRETPQEAWNHKQPWCKAVLSTTGPVDLNAHPNTQTTTPQEQRYLTGLTGPSKNYIQENCGEYPWKERRT